VAIRKGGIAQRDELPDPNEVLGPHDYLVVVGRAEDVRAFGTAFDVTSTPPATPAPTSSSGVGE
jgi:hypothetical protein